MATTRLMPLHTGKGRTVGQAISAKPKHTDRWKFRLLHGGRIR